MNKLLIALFLVVSIGTAHAAPPRLLPEMTLASITGESVTTSQIQSPGSWLLVYLSGTEKSDRDLLAALQVFHEQTSADRVVLLVAGATQGTLGDIVKGNQKLSALRWMADTDRSAAGLLQLSGSSMIMGVRGDVIQWAVAGSGTDQKKLQSLLFDWVK